MQDQMFFGLFFFVSDVYVVEKNAIGLKALFGKKKTKRKTPQTLLQIKYNIALFGCFGVLEFSHSKF